MGAADLAALDSSKTLMRKIINDFVKFQDASLAKKWNGKKVPFSRVYEAYMEGQIDIERRDNS